MLPGQASRSLLELPNETLENIFLHLSQSPLAVVARVSKRFRAVSERLLYATATLSDILSDSSSIPTRTLHWCQSISQRTHLQDSVKAVYILWYTDSGIKPSVLDDSCSQLARVLRSLSAVESLELFLGTASAVIPQTMPSTVGHAIDAVLYSCRHPHLRHCTLSAEGAQSYVCTDIIDTFLQSAPALTSLQLLDRYPIFSISTGTLPMLSTFRGSPNAAAMILPGRPISSLSLVGADSDITRDTLLPMTLTSLPLRVLDLAAMAINPALLQNLSTHFPMLHVLKVKLALRHTLHYAISGIRLLAGLSSVLRAFTQLIELDLSPTGVGVGRANAEQELSLCVEWSRGCPSLQHVIFPSGTEWLRSAFLDTWSPFEVE